MQTIRLPYHPGDLDPEKLNRRIHADEIRLDWSDVEPDISQTYLERLFAGMNLVDSIDAIGGDTIPESLIPAIQTAFVSVEAQAKPATLPAQKNEQIAPALWLPEILPSPSLKEPVEDEPIPEAPQAVDTSLLQPARPFLEAPSPSQMREELEEMVLRDLLGPAGGEDEKIDEARVHDRYLVGMLAPGKTQTVPEEHDPLADAETSGPDEGAEEEDTAQKASFNPASLGMSFSVDGKTTELLVSVRWGHYRRADSESITTTYGRPKRGWKRAQRGGEGHRIQLKEGPIPFWQPDVFVRGIIRRSGERRKTIADEQTKTQELLAILQTRSWTKAERVSVKQQIRLYYERKLAILQTALFEAIAVDSPRKLSPFEIDEYIYRYHKQSQELYVYLDYRSSSNPALPMWLKAIDEDERGISVWQPATRLPNEEQQKDQGTL